MLKKYKILIWLLLLLGLPLLPAYAISSINALLHQPGDPIGGNPRGKITIVEFFDYQCSHCVEMAPVMHDIIQSNPDVRVVFKDFAIRGPLSNYAALAALAANRQGKYIEFNQALFSLTQSLSKELIHDTAQSVGLNMEKFKKDMADNKLSKQLQANEELAQSLKITGTPAFFIGKTNATQLDSLQFVLGSMRQSDLQMGIDKAKQ